MKKGVRDKTWPIIILTTMQNSVKTTYYISLSRVYLNRTVPNSQHSVNKVQHIILVVAFEFIGVPCAAVRFSSS